MALRKLIYRTIVGLTFAALTGMAAASEPLFIAGHAADPSPEEPWVARQRMVEINFALLAADTPCEGATLLLNLFPDAEFEAQVRPASCGINTGAWVGTLAGLDESSVQWVFRDGVLVGNIRDGRGLAYQVRYTKEGLHLVKEVDEAYYPPCANGPEHEAAIVPSVGESAIAADCDKGDIFDVLVAYTPKAKNAAGGMTAIENLIDLAVLETKSGLRRERGQLAASPGI